MIQHVTVSVPGKVYLMGEHAVVYGKPAILSAINLRMKVIVEQVRGSEFMVHGKNNIQIISTEPDDYVQHIIKLVFLKYNLEKIPAVKISIKSDIPAGYHLGSSAALAVGVTAALIYYLKQIWNPQLFNQIAYEAEKYQHGNPSGGDNTVITTGGLIWFRKELEFLKSIWQLPYKISDKFNLFYLIDTGRPQETTGEMVGYVSSRAAVHRSEYRTLFDQNEEQVKRIALALKNGDEKELIDAVKMGEQTLEKIGVVSDKVKPLIRQIEDRGGAAKILGGGGKKNGVGFLLCYTKQILSVEKLALKYGYSVQPIKLGGSGVKLESYQ